MTDIKAAFVLTTAAYLAPLKPELNDEAIGCTLEEVGFSKLDTANETSHSWQKCTQDLDQNRVVITVSASTPSPQVKNMKPARPYIDSLRAIWIAYAQSDNDHRKTKLDPSLHIKALNAELQRTFDIQKTENLPLHSNGVQIGREVLAGEIIERALHVKEFLSKEMLTDIIAHGKTDETYVDLQHLPSEQNAFELASVLLQIYAVYSPSIQPVVIGPIKFSQRDLIESCGTRNVRFTPRTFEEHCEAKAAAGQRIAAMYAAKANDGPQLS